MYTQVATVLLSPARPKSSSSKPKFAPQKAAEPCFALLYDHEFQTAQFNGNSRRRSQLGADANSVPVTEVRRLTQTGHQTAVITTARQLGNTTIAGRMFARWCQENYFAYMMEHYDIDGLVEYGAESLPGTHQVVNPRWRELDKAVRQTRQSQRKLQAELARTALNDGGEIQKNAESVESLQAVQEELKRLLSKRKETSRKVTIDSLPEAERPTQLPPLNKSPLSWTNSPSSNSRIRKPEQK